MDDGQNITCKCGTRLDVKLIFKKKKTKDKLYDKCPICKKEYHLEHRPTPPKEEYKNFTFEMKLIQRMH